MKKEHFSGLDLTVVRCRAYRVKPVVEKNGCLYFVKETNLTAPVKEGEEYERVLEAGMLKELGRSEFSGASYADILQQIPEDIEQRVSAFRVLPEKVVVWYGGLLPEAMYAQHFFILGQRFVPARSYRYAGPELHAIRD